MAVDIFRKNSGAELVIMHCVSLYPALAEGMNIGRIKALREKAQKECTEKYCTEHKYHCFRCGSQSLVEIQKGKVSIDICVNENCGAVHLDPGELEELVKDASIIKNAKNSIFNIFK